jgi:hypothetical protein
MGKTPAPMRGGASGAASGGGHGGAAQSEGLIFLSTSQRGNLLTAVDDIEAAIARLGERSTENLKAR